MMDPVTPVTSRAPQPLLPPAVWVALELPPALPLPHSPHSLKCGGGKSSVGRSTAAVEVVPGRQQPRAGVATELCAVFLGPRVTMRRSGCGRSPCLGVLLGVRSG